MDDKTLKDATLADMKGLPHLPTDLATIGELPKGIGGSASLEGFLTSKGDGVTIEQIKDFLDSSHDTFDNDFRAIQAFVEEALKTAAPVGTTPTPAVNEVVLPSEPRESSWIKTRTGHRLFIGKNKEEFNAFNEGGPSPPPPPPPAGGGAPPKYDGTDHQLLTFIDSSKFRWNHIVEDPTKLTALADMLRTSSDADRTQSFKNWVINGDVANDATGSPFDMDDDDQYTRAAQYLGLLKQFQMKPNDEEIKEFKRGMKADDKKILYDFDAPTSKPVYNSRAGTGSLSAVVRLVQSLTDVSLLILINKKNLKSETDVFSINSSANWDTTIVPTKSQEEKKRAMRQLGLAARTLVSVAFTPSFFVTTSSCPSGTVETEVFGTSAPDSAIAGAMTYRLSESKDGRMELKQCTPTGVLETLKAANPKFEEAGKLIREQKRISELKDRLKRGETVSSEELASIVTATLAAQQGML